MRRRPCRASRGGPRRPPHRCPRSSRRGLGRLALREGDARGAVEAIDEKLRAADAHDRGTLHAARGELLFALGSSDGARGAWEEAARAGGIAALWAASALADVADAAS